MNLATVADINRAIEPTGWTCRWSDEDAGLVCEHPVATSGLVFEFDDSDTMSAHDLITIIKHNRQRVLTSDAAAFDKAELMLGLLVVSRAHQLDSLSLRAIAGVLFDEGTLSADEAEWLGAAYQPTHPEGW